MLADSIEAAVRSIPDPNPEKVDALIRKLVRVKLDDGQLDQSDLTFGDLEKICSAFSTVLTGVFHERIEYPDVAIPPRNEVPRRPPRPAKPARNPRTRSLRRHPSRQSLRKVPSRTGRDNHPAKPAEARPGNRWKCPPRRNPWKRPAGEAPGHLPR